jgi:hypothetical protein
MKSNRTVLVLLSFATVLLMGATVLQATATSKVVSAGSAASVVIAGHRGRSGAAGPEGYLFSSLVQEHVAPSRSMRGQCFDVSLPELIGCRALSAGHPNVGTGNSRTPPDECFDVSFRESCER